MKRFLNWLKNIVLRHKLLSIICFLAFVVILIMLYVFFSLFVGGNDVYGNRLAGIKEVQLSNSELKKIASSIEKNGEVKDADVHLKGKIIYIDVIFTNETSKDKAKEIAKKTLDEFDKDEKSFYDFEYILTQENSAGFKITGTSGPKTDGISFIKS